MFCPKCGKAVFEEYMDDDDIWDEYDREPKVAAQTQPPEVKSGIETRQQNLFPLQRLRWC